MRDDVLILLGSFGVAGAESDVLLDFVINSVSERVKNEINQQEIPEGLRYVSAEMAVGEYLNLKKSTGQLNVEGLDLEAAVKQIQEGDTNTVFAIGEGSQTPEQRLDGLILYLTHDRTREFLRYRKMLW